LKKLCFVLLTIVFVSCTNSEKKKSDSQADPLAESTETTIYYLIRHAEKDRNDPDNRDPELLPKGHERAKAWATYFSDKDLDLIYTTPYLRTMQTALYTASEQQIEPLQYDPAKLYSEEFQKNTKGKNVLVVGHSNTTPAFVNSILGAEKYTDMDDKDNGSLFIVTIINNSKDVQVITID
jgi:2,3-bisphosphoglycerate-dependent phosphoglycerate mutase